MAILTESQIQKLQDELYAKSSDIQNLLNKLLAKGGVITQEEINAVEEQARQNKEQLMAAKAKSTTNKLIIGGAVVVFALGFLFVLTKEKK